MGIVKRGMVISPNQQPLYYAVGDTLKHKDELKSRGFRWDSEEKTWFTEGFVDVSDLDGIRLEEIL